MKHFLLDLLVALVIAGFFIIPAVIAACVFP